MADRERDTSSGRFTDKYPRADILAVISDRGGTAATSEIAEKLDADRNTIYKKLRIMENDGQVESRKAGGIRVWSSTTETPD